MGSQPKHTRRLFRHPRGCRTESEGSSTDHHEPTQAKADDYDVFNALDIMENNEFLKELKFGIGDGQLQYYLYNWRCGGVALTTSDIGLVLL